ncbi:hypothetical protein BDW62DRAFT_216017 [Aspergillus aurantiobrunneus]
MLPVTKVYHGVNCKEFLLLMRRLEAHFEEWEDYYSTDNTRIDEACRHLSEGIDRCEFCVWLSSNIRNFVNPEVAERRYKAVRQRKQQSVSRFAAFLGSLEANLPRLLSDQERCQRLWEGVLPEIRKASRSGFPSCYHTGVTELCAAARSLRGGRPRRGRRGGRRAS